MAQIQKGTTYATGGSVTAANLNAHVDAATLLSGAIIEQTTAPSVASTNQILTSDGVGLYKTTLASIISPLNLFDKSQAQTLGQNVSLASGADIALASGSIMSLSSGAAISLSSGAILTLGQDPVSAFQAVPKQYVDNGFLSKITGGIVSGSISMIGTSSILTLSKDPINSLEAAPKQYVDNTTSNEVARIRLQTTVGVGSTNTLITTSNINATYSQTGSTGTVSVPDASLWESNLSPFFLAGQYIGVLSGGTPALTPRLYKIQSVDYAAKTFTITGPDSTTRTGSIVLSCVYRNTTPPLSTTKIDSNGNKNIKSVYVCMASNKYYINYWFDTKGTALNAAPTEIDGGEEDDQKLFVSGVALNGTGASITGNMSPILMTKVPGALSTTLIYSQDQPVGFGATSKGAHVGFFYTYNNGSAYTYIWDSNVSIFR